MPISYIAVEGQHDAALIGCLLSNGGFSLLKKRGFVDPAFERYYVQKLQDSLVGRPADCHYWKRGEHSVALHPVGGDSQLVVAGATVSAQIIGPMDSLGFFIDADQDSPVNRFQKLIEDVLKMKSQPGFQFPSDAGLVHEGPPRCGVFVFPNNQDQGAIEAILESCAEVAYPDLFSKSLDYLQSIDRDQLITTEQRRLASGSNEKKARLSVIGSILSPAAAIQNTIREDRWVCDATLSLSFISNVRAFLRELLNEPTI